MTQQDTTMANKEYLAPERTTPISKEEFIKEVNELTLDLMDLIYTKRPDIATVADAVMRVAVGILAQVPEERRQVLREIMHYAIDIEVDPETVIDLSPRLRS